jgi:hypothetical protein
MSNTQTTQSTKSTQTQDKIKLKIDVIINNDEPKFNNLKNAKIYPEIKKADENKICYISDTSDSDNEEPLKKRSKVEKIQKPKCPGCYPIFQENQLGHIGPNGCLGAEY